MFNTLQKNHKYKSSDLLVENQKKTMFRQQIKSISKLLDTSDEYVELNTYCKQTRMKTFIDT